MQEVDKIYESSNPYTGTTIDEGKMPGEKKLYIAEQVISQSILAK